MVTRFVKNSEERTHNLYESLMKLKPGTTGVSVRRIDGESCAVEHDLLAVEEPLEIRLGFREAGGRTSKSIAVTMRTPNNPQDDFELAAGFLFSEGIIQERAQIKRIFHCGAPLDEAGTRNTLRVDVHDDVAINLKCLERHFYTTSSCGVCGKTSIDAIEMLPCPLISREGSHVSAVVIHNLPRTLRRAQTIFERTGGLHAAALFDLGGRLLNLREDVGRHNAVDKLIGAELLCGRVPLSDKLILVSGRASFELVQKCLAAGAPLLAAVGAPSSLAVELAREFGMTLLGFVRENRFNIYAGAQRIDETACVAEPEAAQVVRASVVS